MSDFLQPMDCSLPGSSVHEILQARILERVAIPSPGDLPNPGTEPGSPALQADLLSSQSLDGEGNGNPPQYSCLENSMNREAWQATVHGLQSWTQLSTHM